MVHNTFQATVCWFIYLLMYPEHMQWKIREKFKSSPRTKSVIKNYTAMCTVITADDDEIERNDWWVEWAIDRNVLPKKHKSPNTEDILISSFIKLPPGSDS
eukprot:4660605-Ditylum_brightwellii.AAC.1